MKNLLKRSFLVGMGALSITRERAESLIKELEQKGEVTKGEAKDLVNELVEKGEQERTTLKDAIKRELDGLTKAAGLVTKVELAELERRISSLEARLSGEHEN